MSDNPKDIIGSKKVNMTLFPPSAVIAGARNMMDGAKKYGPYNWRKTNVRMSVYLDATLRHLYSLFDGEDLTRDSKVSHLTCILCNMAILIDADLNGGLIDDRPTKGHASDLLEQLEIKE